MIKILLLISVAIHCTQSANILGVFPMATGSHYILNFNLLKGLADAGHDVTIISPSSQKTLPKTKGKITEIVLSEFMESLNEMVSSMNLFEFGNANVLQMMLAMVTFPSKSTNDTFYHPKVRTLLESSQKFDAVIVEHFFNDALKIFSTIYDCPLIILFSVGPGSWINPVVGNPEELSYIRHFYARGNPSAPMTFLQRTANIFYYVLDHAIKNILLYPLHDKIIQGAFPGGPKVTDLNTNASLVLLNSHTSLYLPQPLVPNMVEIGGYHINPPKRLPQELQEFIDQAKHGVVYFSMGSNLKSKRMSEARKQIFLRVLGKLKQKVIWKFEEELPGKPDNMLIKSWLPQQDILAHPNVKLFITHGGLLSTTETVYHGVPILAIPVFGDQPSNAERAEYAGYARKISYHDSNFTEERFGELLNEMLTNPKYTENVKERSRLFHDRPMKPMESAVYWVEYVIRNHGARHLRVGGIHQPWYQYYMFDVAVFLIVVTSIIIALSVFLLKKMCNKLISISSKTKKIKTN